MFKKSILAAIFSLLPIVSVQAQNLPMGQSSLAFSQRPQVLSFKEKLGSGVPVPVQIPYKTSPDQTQLHMRLWTRQWSRVGGQNRSGETHPGFGYMNNPVAGLDMRFEGSDGYAALPGSWNGHFVGQEWGPTESASPGEWIDQSDWPVRCEEDPTCYWGAATYQGPRSYRDTMREYVIEEGGPYWTQGTIPGNIVYFTASGWWDGNGWDGSHAWPVRIDFTQTTVLYLEWH
jgi:hypothetical protein